MVAVPSNIKQRILILAPIGRDAELISGALGKSGLVSEAAPDLPALCRELEAGAAAAIVAEEALTAPAVDQLLELLEAQQPWSELPVMVLLSQEPVPNAAALGRVLEELNATLLERPISMRALVSAAKAAVRARRRQYEIRNHLLDLAQARHQAEEAVRIRDEFLASVAHDLKNPLTSIKGYAQLLQRQAAKLAAPEAARLVRDLASIDAMASKTVDQLNELVDLARLQAHQPLELNLQPLDLVALVRQTVTDYSRINGGHTIELIASVPELYGVWDELRLERVLGNLLSNALKYSPPGSTVRVHVDPDDEPSGASWAVVKVEDQGIGIPAAELPHVFERFFRASNAVNHHPGAGLGLAGARQIVVQHGGSMSVESTLNQGSTFTMRLPVIQEVITKRGGR
jgi:signal transduction histidine kinase